MTKDEIANDLLQIGAVKISPDHPFTWTSGLTSPIYCDNRLTMSYPEIRKKLTMAFADMIKQMEGGPDVIAGCATAGIPHAAWLSDYLGLPMVYVRSKPKGHGKGNQIEGNIKKGQRVILIEDLVSTGGSALNAVQALQEEGAEVTAVCAIFTYGLTGTAEAFLEQGVSLSTITDFDSLVAVLEKKDGISEKGKKQLFGWREALQEPAHRS
ncbi:orotate phosphoribosyltransferase [Sediminibacillus dalangtanensis]|uniref:Orotate phosphoribosyltransferase n=2 Tax=Sediminibacillus dalangtanensis TaxID=2729421 RepID=A0ABX7VXY6_9BACI|nr:orotate phosphoribosyltransferase [Sediminibacillus dalangtanensis]